MNTQQRIQKILAKAGIASRRKCEELIVQGRVTELRIQNSQVNAVNKGDVFSFPLSEKIRPSDKLYKVIESGEIEKIVNS